MKKVLILCLITLQWMACNAQENRSDFILDHEKITPLLDKLIDQYLDLDIFSGVVLVAEKGEPVYHKAFGLAHRENKISNSLTTKFDIGSMNKTFTKIVILQLIDEGLLKLNDPLGKFLVGFNPEISKQVTVEHLLNHQSGFGDYYDPAFFDVPKEEKTISGLLERIKGMNLDFPPGAEQQYSNTGYVLLGAIIEKLSGMSYVQNVRKRIVGPMNMTETYLENKEAVPERSIGYYKDALGNIYDNEGFLEIPKPDGGFQSTTQDILKFYREYYYGNQLLSEKAKALDEHYEFHQAHMTTGGAMTSAGGFNGANTVIFEILRDQISILVFANMDEPVAEQLGKGILNIVRGKAPQRPVLPARQNIYQAFKKKGIKYVKANFEDLSTNFHADDPRDWILNITGYDLLSANQVEDAIPLFRLNTELFPDVANCWDSLGEALLKNGERREALKAYQQALKLESDLPSALEALRILKEQ